MECQSSDSKKIFKVFDATKRKRTRKKQQPFDDTKSIASDDSNGICQIDGRRVSSAKASFQDISPDKVRNLDDVSCKRDRGSSLSIPRSPVEEKRASRSPRRQRRIARDGVSLALKAGLVSTPRSLTPQQDYDGIESVPHDQDSFMYALLEEAIKRDKKKHRHGRRRDDRRSHECENSPTRDHRHHGKHRDEPAHKENKSKKEEITTIDQAVLLETFAKLCAQMNEKTLHRASPERVARSQSHKSLQCEAVPKPQYFQVPEHTAAVHSKMPSKQYLSPSRIRSHDDCRERQSRGKVYNTIDDRDENSYFPSYEKSHSKYTSNANIVPHSREDERLREYSLKVNPTRCCIDRYYRDSPIDHVDDRRYDERRGRLCDQREFERKASRSFDVTRTSYQDDGCRRTARSDGVRDRNYGRDYRRYDERSFRLDEPKDIRNRDYTNYRNKERRGKQNLDLDRASIVTRDDDFRERDKYSERERDSGMSVADGETSTVSGKSNYLRAVKQEITEQREAMDKMMKLWKELMRCFKGVSQSEAPTNNKNESSPNVRESAAAQLRLWRECMRRYETVARDVGDTDARLMEEINKQRSEMAEMANMWQECLQRYRDMSDDFNSLKKQLKSESPTRLPAPALVCAEGEGVPPPAPYRLPTNYPPPVHDTGGLYVPGVPLKAHASAPPAAPAPPPWWWAERGPSPRRRSSPDSRASRERHHRHKDKERDDTRYKDKCKANGARSEHRHRKR